MTFLEQLQQKPDPAFLLDLQVQLQQKPAPAFLLDLQVPVTQATASFAALWEQEVGQLRAMAFSAWVDAARVRLQAAQQSPTTSLTAADFYYTAARTAYLKLATQYLHPQDQRQIIQAFAQLQQEIQTTREQRPRSRGSIDLSPPPSNEA